MLDATADASLDSDTHVTADATSAQGAIAIAVGWNTSCAVMASGLVECWGFGERKTQSADVGFGSRSLSRPARTCNILEEVP
jgi:hypothetical protein